MREVFHYIQGRQSAGESSRRGEVFDPATGQVQAHVPLGGAAELKAAMNAALAAQPDWAAVSAQRRSQVLFRFKALIEQHLGTLARLLSSEHGKVLADARGDIRRSCSRASTRKGSAPGLMSGPYASPWGWPPALPPSTFRR